jgi:hypothetical protein
MDGKEEGRSKRRADARNHPDGPLSGECYHPKHTAHKIEPALTLLVSARSRDLRHSAWFINVTAVRLALRLPTHSAGGVSARNPSRSIVARCACTRMLMALFRTVAMELMQRMNPPPPRALHKARRCNADRSFAALKSVHARLSSDAAQTLSRSMRGGTCCPPEGTVASRPTAMSMRPCSLSARNELHALRRCAGLARRQDECMTCDPPPTERGARVTAGA